MAKAAKAAKAAEAAKAAGTAVTNPRPPRPATTMSKKKLAGEKKTAYSKCVSAAAKAASRTRDRRVDRSALPGPAEPAGPTGMSVQLSSRTEPRRELGARLG